MCNVAGGAHEEYTYIDDLREFENCQHREQPKLPPGALRVLTPLKVQTWSALLAGHPDGEFVKYILNGISHGFRIGFNHIPGHELHSAKRNMQSAMDHSKVIDEYLQDECAKQRVILIPKCQGFISADSV